MNRFLRLYILLAISLCCKSTGLCNYSTHKSRQNTLTEEKKYILPDSFFAKVAVADIGTIDTTNVKYRKQNWELLGYAYSPILGYEKKNNKRPKYLVIIQESYTRKKNNRTNNETSIDSIGIRSITIVKISAPEEKSDIIHMQYKNKLEKFKENDFDYSTLADIRKNFILRTKYTKYYLGKETLELPILTEVYPIY